MNGYVSFAVVVVLATLVAQLDAGCLQASCCKGKDNNCHSKGKRMNPRPGAKKNTTSCFCDETCLDLGDCCTDYRLACIAQDCVLGDWEDWGECSENCGWGHKRRGRPVLREGQYGGVPCGDTSQKTYCLGLRCKGRRAGEGTQELSETGSIVPAQYGGWRQDKTYNPYNDIRKNLFNHYEKEKLVKNPSYSARFEVTETRRACRNPLAKGWSASLQVGQTVCVECQPSAMKKRLGLRCKGHGVYLLEARWNAVTIPGCHGKWRMVTERSDVGCNGQDDHSFVLV